VHVQEAIERCRRATLIFDVATIAANIRRTADAARAVGIRPLFAMKSFPRPEVLALAADALDGFDVASPEELRNAPASKIVSIADPSGAAITEAHARTGRVIAACETLEQVRAAPPHAEIALRLSASLCRLDPAIGSVHDGNRRRSRFGIETREMVAELAAAARGRPVGLHVHHGPITASTGERFLASARAAMAVADFEPAFIDLGGAWHGVPDIAAAFAEVRAGLPASIEIIVEPGRIFCEGAGFAFGRVTAARPLKDRELRVLDLSRICHVWWSPVELVAQPPRPDSGRRVFVVGPTCFEEDTLGEWTIEPAQLAAHAVFSGVNGYSVAWNRGFAGVAPAEVILT
jgi:diaminopimelate decarboxylase